MLVKALRKCFVGGNFRVADEQFDYTGPKNTNLAPVKAAKGRDADADLNSTVATINEDEREK
jgi:hypothetical protein